MNRMIYSKSVLAAGTLIFVLAAAADSLAQSSDARIVAIKKIAAETDRLAEIAERPDEYSSVFIAELNVNRKENPYPAVGLFTSTAKFYYTYGDREKNPYPDRLRKIAVVTRRASAVESTEIFFNPAGEMILYSKKIESDGPLDRSVYFLTGKPIRFERDGKAAKLNDPETTMFLKSAIADKIRLTRIFQAAPD